MANPIVIIGAGVSGLTSALLLSRDKENAITVVAKHVPGDYDAEYASPWAGANFIPLASEDKSKWERRTWPELKRLASDVPEAGIHFQKIRLQRRNKDKAHEASGFHGAFSPDPWFKSLFDDFRELDKSEVAAGYDAGYGFTTVCINTAIYLPWLLGQCARNGVIFRRARLSDISEAQHLSHTGRPPRFVVNCTGLGALRLGGVNDTNMAPCRGQTILVRNDTPAMLMFSGTEDGPSEETYVMQRAVGGGTILGGTYEPGNWDPVPDPNSATRIMKRVVDVCPEIAGGKGVKGLDVVRHAVGFRPFRAGGVRVEKEKRGDTWIIHNYGHDSWGYLGSYGCAEGVVELLNGAQDVKSRL